MKEVEVVEETGMDGPVIARVRQLVEPIAADLGLDVYDVERRGGTLRVTLDSKPGSETGITLDELALASRLVSRELDHADPVPGRYTLEVTSPGVERALRTPAHFQREIGKEVAIRLADVGHDERRVTGTLIGADDTTASVRVDGPDGPTERTIRLDQIDRAKTVFEWPSNERAPRSPRSGSPRSSKTDGTRRTKRTKGNTKESLS